MASLSFDQLREEMGIDLPYLFNDPHSWLHDLRKLQQMLESKYPLPHQTHEVYYKNTHNPVTFNNLNPNDPLVRELLRSGKIEKILIVITCPICSAAHNLRCKYILSKEGQSV